MIGNGLMNYDFNAGNGNPVYDDYRDFVDGFCMEHTMGFEVKLRFITAVSDISHDFREQTMELQRLHSLKLKPWRI